MGVDTRSFVRKGVFVRGRATIVLFFAAAISLTAQTNVTGYQPLSGKGRIKWAAVGTVGAPSLAGGLVSAGFGTAIDRPEEFDTHWNGFGKRYGMRLTGVATSNAMEAGLGAIWGEDPRYPRAAGQPFGRRIGHVFKMTVMAPNREGLIEPAYARFAAISASNALSNAWRPDSDVTAQRTGIRIGLGFLGRLASNAFVEFWPDVKDRFPKR